MARIIVLSSVLLFVALASAQLREKRGSLLDTAAGLYSNVWAGLAGDSAKEACKAVGYGRPLANRNRRTFFDQLVPKFVADMAGQVHMAAVPESMRAEFCFQQGLGKDIPEAQGPPVGGGVQYVYDPPVDVGNGQYSGQYQGQYQG